MDFKTNNNSLKGLFTIKKSGKLLFPCQLCAGEVTDNSDSRGLGIKCDGSVVTCSLITTAPADPLPYHTLMRLQIPLTMSRIYMSTLQESVWQSSPYVKAN